MLFYCCWENFDYNSTRKEQNSNSKSFLILDTEILYQIVMKGVLFRDDAAKNIFSFENKIENCVLEWRETENEGPRINDKKFCHGLSMPAN